MSRTFEVLETFELTWRTGPVLVVALPVHVIEIPHKVPLLVSIRVEGRPPLQASAFHELLPRSASQQVEVSALVLSGLVKAQVPIGSVLEVKVNASEV